MCTWIICEHRQEVEEFIFENEAQSALAHKIELI